MMTGVCISHEPFQRISEHLVDRVSTSFRVWHGWEDSSRVCLFPATCERAALPASKGNEKNNLFWIELFNLGVWSTYVVSLTS